MRAFVLVLLLGFEVAAGELLQPVFRLRAEGSGPRYATSNQFEFAAMKAKIERVAFRALLTNQWLPGLVPVFALERKGQFELRRLPLRGQENITEPFFFALPAHEDSSARIAGRWKCEARRADGSLVYPDFEIAAQGTNLAMRFDQSTEYRFAFITRATFVTDRIELFIENVSDHYEMSGRLEGERLGGTWRHMDGREKGTWEARRDLPRFVVSEASVVLYEWRRSNGSVEYGLEGESIAEAVRVSLPLCRVWAPR